MRLDLSEYRTLLAAIAAIIANSWLAWHNPEKYPDVVTWNAAIAGFVAGRSVLKDGPLGGMLAALTNPKDGDTTDPSVSRARTPRSP